MQSQFTIPALESQTSPLDEVWVALDVETTGLDPDSDEIIEVGAIKFRGENVQDTFLSFANPGIPLNTFTKRYTGIIQQDVDKAPSFSYVGNLLSEFIGTTPLVGHNLPFDLSFLAAKGITISSPVCDTWDLAYVMLPEQSEYGLAKVAAALGITHHRPHRAMADVEVTHRVFLKLMDMASALDVLTLAEMERLASRSSWILSYFLRRLEMSKIASRTSPLSDVGAMGFDVNAIRDRLKRHRTLRPNSALEKIDPREVTNLLEIGGPLSGSIPGFEQREEQIAMTKAVAEAISDGKRLIVEAGTGVGKSLAYLLPAALYAIKNNKRVVISTNTINLQEQLLNKDVPVAAQAVAALETDRLKYAQLKGRSNYLCLKRLVHMRSNPIVTVDEARMLSKALVWIRSTTTGDRGEINLSNRMARAPWDRMSAQGARDCTGVNGACFLRAARDGASASHIVIVNHSLLLTNVVVGGTLIPDYDVLIVDEAQHLEEEATRQFGFEVGQRTLHDHFEELTNDRGLLHSAVAAFHGSKAATSRRKTTESTVARISNMLPLIRDSVARLFGLMGNFIDGSNQSEPQVRVTTSTRTQPAWSDVEIQWENVDVSMKQLQTELNGLGTALAGLDNSGMRDYDSLLMELTGITQTTMELRDHLEEFVPNPKSDAIYWLNRPHRTNDLMIHGAPLHVGELLEKSLYSQKSSTVLTGATLSASGTFDHIRERIGFSDADELLLGSPFDYPQAAMLCVPQDIPEPTVWEHQAAVAEAVVSATEAAEGRTMALFTSYTALHATSRSVRGRLQSNGFNVLAQGVDGTPHQLLKTFLEEPKSVLLGTASFWEGVDLAGEALQVLLLARLPFSVPTEPVFNGRSELYDNPFYEYAIPQAILRLRQGFGRLIRTKKDRGVVVVLDKRITSRQYGKLFQDSLPPVTMKSCLLTDVPKEIQQWLGK